jgi:hypothetical protein
MLNKIWLFLESFIQKAINLVEWLFLSIFNAFCDIVFFLIDVVLSTITTIIEAVDFAELSTLETFSEWSVLPDQVLWVLGYMNFGQCLSLLAGAYVIRLLLNLIPAAFTRI